MEHVFSIPDKLDVHWMSSGIQFFLKIHSPPAMTSGARGRLSYFWKMLLQYYFDKQCDDSL